MFIGFISKEEEENLKKRAKYRMYHTRVEVKTVELILVVTTEGGMDETDPVRKVSRYFDKDGTLVFEIDPISEDR